MKFKVIDPNTNEEADAEQVVLNEAWADGLMWCDMEGFAIGEDGTLYLMDECGSMRCCPPDRFRVEFEAQPVRVQ